VTKRPDLKEWAEGLAKVQEANAMSKKSRPADAVDCALFKAAADNDIEGARSMLEQGYCPNIEQELAPKFGTSPLMEACFHGNAEITKMFIEHNAEMNI